MEIFTILVHEVNGTLRVVFVFTDRTEAYIESHTAQYLCKFIIQQTERNTE